jgi:hypothetical protein
LGGTFNPAPAVEGTFVCSKTSTDAKTPDCRSANAAINPPIPAPTITARILSSFRSKRTHRTAGSLAEELKLSKTSPLLGAKRPNCTAEESVETACLTVIQAWEARGLNHAL